MFNEDSELDSRLSYNTGFLDGLSLVIGLVNGPHANSPVAQALIAQLKEVRNKKIAERTALLNYLYLIDVPDGESVELRLND